jgi:hypothetical protein
MSARTRRQSRAKLRTLPFLLGFLAFMLIVPLGIPSVAFGIDLTDVWIADDGGAYYLRQIGSSLWWAGLSDRGRGFSFANVFRGRLLQNDTISGSWADVPRGKILSNGGMLLSIQGSELRKLRESGGFGGSVWRRGAGETGQGGVVGGYRPGPNDLTGVWACDDGAVYHVRQIGEQVWWMGLSDRGQGSSFTNVFWGRISGRFVNGEWVDVPRGRFLSSGVLTLEIGSTTGIIFELRKQRESGGFAGSSWRRL